MHLDGHCPGCGGGEGNQSCKIARCSLQYGKPEYCSQCQEFPCEKYENIDAFDSFVTHQNRKKDLEKQQKIGVEEYRAEKDFFLRSCESSGIGRFEKGDGTDNVSREIWRAAIKRKGCLCDRVVSDGGR